MKDKAYDLTLSPSSPFLQRGFHLTFENGFTLSVQFGKYNYCDEGDTAAEIAIFIPGEDFGFHRPKGWPLDVKGWVTPEELSDWIIYTKNL